MVGFPSTEMIPLSIFVSLHANVPGISAGNSRQPKGRLRGGSGWGWMGEDGGGWEAGWGIAES